MRRRAWSLRATTVAVLATAPLAQAQYAPYTNTGVHPPIALHQLVIVPAGGDAVVPLRGYDKDGDPLKATVQSLPGGTGAVYQLSKVYSDYGYEPKKGVAVAVGQDVTGSQGNRIYYKRPAADAAPVGAYGIMTYTVKDLTSSNKVKSESPPGMVTFVPPSGIVVGSHFSRGAEGWTIVGNKASGGHPVTYEASSRGELNHYVYGSDDTINTADASGNDLSLWYFQAPPKFLGHQGIAYGGTLDFTLSSFHGDFGAGKLNTGLPGQSAGLHLVEVYCAACNVNRGVTLAFPVKALPRAFSGSTLRVAVPLRETAGWVEDPKNTLVKWAPPTQCTFIEVLSGLTSLKILGDFTKWYESVALDTVQFINLKAQVPVCAQVSPDASQCTCSTPGGYGPAYPNTVVPN